MVDAQTRNKALLDILITNNPELMVNVEVRENLAISDHVAITFPTLSFKKYKAEGTLSTFQHYKKCKKKCKRAIRAAKIENERDIAEGSKKNPKFS